MIYDANDIDRSAIPKADICIIGSGAAGLAMAHSLIGSGKTVTVLESSRHNDVGVPPEQDGHRYQDSDIQEKLYDGSMPDPSPGASAREFFIDSRIKAYGGTTNCWKGWTRPLDDMDFTALPPWPRDVRKELYDPDAADRANQPYQKAMRYCSFPWDYRSAYHDLDYWVAESEDKPLAVMPYTGRLRTEVVVKIGAYKGGGRIDRYWDFQLAWGPAIEKATNVTIYRNANVRQLLRSTATGPIESVKATTIKKGPVRGDDFTVKADKFVLAAGCVENVRLMLHSKITATGLGKYLMTHPLDVQAAHIYAPNMPDPVRDYYGGHEIPVMVTEAPPTVMAMLTPHIGLIKLERIGNFRIWLRFGMVRSDVYVDLNWEQEPVATNCITLDPTKKDPLFGDPLPMVTLTLSEQDKKTKTVAIDQLEDVLVTNGYADGLTRLYNPPKLTGEHALGGTRMGWFASEGVVDHNCRVFTCDNLYVAGGSVFPTGGWANPTLTIIALALRLADHLKAQK